MWLTTTLRIVLSILVLFTLLTGPALSETVVPIIFPVAADITFTDTFGAPRDGGKRKHEGNDLFAKKMTPLLAVVDGTVDWLNDGTQTSTANGLPYYNLLLRGDDGNDYYYVHLNNDSIGTDDAMGGVDRAYAPGIYEGKRVIAGETLGYLGDSGNAENTPPHLHFEIHLGGYKNPINPYASLMAAIKNPLYRDIQPTDWAFKYVNNLSRGGVIDGYSNGSFRPEKLVTRAEFVKMVVGVTGIETATAHGGLFPDVGAEHWSWPYVEGAKRVGLVDGDMRGKFVPDAPINRAEAAKIITKARALTGGVLAASTTAGSSAAFTDVEQDFWGYEPIMVAKSAGLISGYPDTTFRPLNSTSRAEASKIIYLISGK